MNGHGKELHEAEWQKKIAVTLLVFCSLSEVDLYALFTEKANIDYFCIMNRNEPHAVFLKH